jgi:Fe-S-cluster containining protein
MDHGTDDVRARLERLAADHEQARLGIAELQQQIETLIEIMVAAGTLRPGHAELIAKLRRRVEVARKAEVELSGVEDKHAVTGEPIDCESRLPLCQARCCSFAVMLSRQDLAEGELTWDIDRPYVLARGPDGYCGHLGRDDAHCQRYDHRPATCRSYTCRTDRRVWIDFDARIPAPMPPTLIAIHRLTARRDG